MNHNSPPPQNTVAGDFRSQPAMPMNGNSAMAPMPYRNGHGRNATAAGGPKPFDVARSPPNPSSKNTKHVPCKFFKQGACQAGQACPFSHSLDPAVEKAPCKYFTKGNCKFGAKCSLEHVLPDGRRVDKSGRNGHLSIGGRVNPPMYPQQDSNITNSMLLRQQYEVPYGPLYPYGPQDEMGSMHIRRPTYENVPSIDTGVTSNPGSNYGSPIDENRFASMSPNRRHPTALDVPLPGSFDSNGVSNYARHGPFAASVPSKFGVESPPQSIVGRTNAPSETIRTLHDTAYGSTSSRPQGLASSPPSGVGNSSESTIGVRLMHSRKSTRPKLVSQSVPRTSIAEDWDDGFAVEEEDLLPTNLHDDVLTPQEKMRRLSKPEHDMGMKDFGGGLGIPSAGSSKVGSPLASSPSRFSELFARQRKKRDEDGSGLSSSPFGPVGSPLRESSLSHFTAGSIQTPATRMAMADASNPTFNTGRNSSVSLLASQLGRQNLNTSDSGEVGTNLHPSSARHVSAPIPINSRYDRTISSPSLNTTRIEEECDNPIFPMEVEPFAGSNSQAMGHAPESRVSEEVKDRREFFADVKSIRFGDT